MQVLIDSEYHLTIIIINTIVLACKDTFCVNNKNTVMIIYIIYRRASAYKDVTFF